MSNLTNRIKQLEKQSGAYDVYKYMCNVYVGWSERLQTPEEKAQGYKIQPFIPSFGGTGGEAFYLQTVQELKDFAARADVDLSIYVIGAQNEIERAEIEAKFK